MRCALLLGVVAALLPSAAAAADNWVLWQMVETTGARAAVERRVTPASVHSTKDDCAAAALALAKQQEGRGDNEKAYPYIHGKVGAWVTRFDPTGVPTAPLRKIAVSAECWPVGVNPQ